MRVEGRTAIITGASSGIGQATAALLCEARVNAVLASRNRKNLEGLALDLVSLPGQTLVVPTDVTDRLAVEALVRKTVEAFGSVDILINNAGTGLFAPIAGGNPDNQRRLFEVNFWRSTAYRPPSLTCRRTDAGTSSTSPRLRRR
jgi:NADP-dependent 3-hydroxy acid dehydrogenase YdfG